MNFFHLVKLLLSLSLSLSSARKIQNIADELDEVGTHFGCHIEYS